MTVRARTRRVSGREVPRGTARGGLRRLGRHGPLLPIPGSAPGTRTRRTRRLVRPRARSTAIRQDPRPPAQGAHARGDRPGGPRRSGAGRRRSGRGGRGRARRRRRGAERSTLDAFSAAAGVPASLIQAVEREGIRIGHVGRRSRRATRPPTSRSSARRCGCWSSGCRSRDLLALARDADAAMRALADRAVDLFDEHVRKPIRDTAGDDAVAARAVGRSVRRAAPRRDSLVSHHFRRVLLETAEERFEMPARIADDRPAPDGRREAAPVRRLFDTISPALRPREPGDDVRDGRGLATPGGAGLRLARAGSRVSTSRAAPATSAASSRARGYRAVGFDFSYGMLVERAHRRAARGGRHPARCRSPDASADGVTCGFALRNVVSLEGLFAELGRVVRPGGRDRVARCEPSRPRRGARGPRRVLQPRRPDDRWTDLRSRRLRVPAALHGLPAARRRRSCGCWSAPASRTLHASNSRAGSRSCSREPARDRGVRAAVLGEDLAAGTGVRPAGRLHRGRAAGIAVPVRSGGAGCRGRSAGRWRGRGHDPDRCRRPLDVRAVGAREAARVRRRRALAGHRDR